MRPKLHFAIAFLCLGSIQVLAQAPNWSEHIAPIIYQNCSNCHHPGGLGPFSLMDYSEAGGMATQLKSSVQAKRMPPWPPNVNYKRLAHERILSQAQIDAISQWADNGAPEGNPALAPTPPVFNTNSSIGTPDLDIKIPAYTIPSSTDLYRCFVLPTGFTTQQFITAFECIPGNSAVVHHVLVYQDTSNTPNQLDAADPGPGYTNFGGPGSSTAKLIGGWVPGSAPNILPTGMGIMMEANAKIILQVHYPSGTMGERDSTRIIMRLSNNPTLRAVNVAPILNHGPMLVDGPLFIPANTTRTYRSQFTLPANITLLTAGPHMHLIGRNIKSWAVTSQNDTIPLIDIPNWDFHWQGSYYFRNPIKIPSGATMFAEAEYDNTPNNPWNPSNPPQDVSQGEATTDEMLLIYFQFMLYRAGDENIVIDNTPLVPVGNVEPINHSMVKTPQLYEPSPNPLSKGQPLSFDFFLPDETEVSLSIFDLNGRQVAQLANGQSYPAGFNTFSSSSLSNLSAGSYMIQMSAAGKLVTKKLVLID